LQGLKFADAYTLAANLAREIEGHLAVAIAARGGASLIVSGGTTPAALFELLSRARLDWPRVQISLVDERWVDPTDAASNEYLVRSTLLKEAASAAQFIPLKTPAATAEQGALDAWLRLSQVVRPFDVVLLGMGTDGHTASLFPDSPGLDAALDAHAEPACVVMRAATAPTIRLSLNLAALSEARHTYLQITGQRKWDVYQEALGSTSRLPISAVLRLLAPRIRWSP
jgi:6-phosphogluconolactonase